MKFNPEINLGAIIELVSLLVVVIGGISKFNTIETKLNIMFDWFQGNVINKEQQKDSLKKFHSGGNN